MQTVLTPPEAVRPEPSGPVLFARYAYGPNRLGFCGPDDAASLFGQGSLGSRDGDERELRQLALGFEGAYPYLRLIAGANGLADPLDRRVVEAYWLGGPMLDAVTPALLGESLRLRYRPRVGPGAWKWLEATVPAGAKPVHAYHVLDVFPKAGSMRGEQIGPIVEHMDACRIRWGRVHERDGDALVVNVVPLVSVAGRLDFGPPRIERIAGWRDGHGFLGDVSPGDVISIHWGWACDVLDRSRFDLLVDWTQRQVEIANTTF